MGEFSLGHWLLIIVIMLLFFGPSKLPQLGKSLGHAIRGFKEGLNEINGEARDLPAKKDNQQINHQQQASQTEKQTENSTTNKS